MVKLEEPYRGRILCAIHNDSSYVDKYKSVLLVKESYLAHGKLDQGYKIIGRLLNMFF